MLKTFWAGPGGWSDRQLPDGRIIWTAPTGVTYVTYPGSRIHFPDWDVGTSEVPNVAAKIVDGGDLAMPKRRRTRAEQRAQRIRDERARNDPFLSPPPPF